MHDIADGLVRAAYDAAQAGDYLRAIWLCEQALERDPQHIAAREYLQQYQESADKDALYEAIQDVDDDRATQLINEYLRNHPEDEWALAARARRAKMPEAALADLNSSLQLDPDQPWTLAERGMVLLTLGRDAEADNDLSRAIELDAENAFFWSTRASLRLTVGHIKEALGDLKQALRIDPDDGLAYSVLAHAAYLMGHFDKVLEHAARARAAGYDVVSMRIDEADSLLRLEHFDTALGYLDTLKAEDDPYVELLRAIALAELKRPQEALDHLDACADRPSSEHAHLAYRAIALLQLGRSDEALPALDDGLEAAMQNAESTAAAIYDVSWFHATRADLSEKYALGLDVASERGRALEILREAVAADPHNLRYAMAERAFAPLQQQMQAMAAEIPGFDTA